jgi:peptidoglycan L-alanyl-D-glutamate endopeptidase CwlK
LTKLDGLHPDLVKLFTEVQKRSPYPIKVVQGLRTPEEQKLNVAKGSSQTLRSRHLTGHALDFGIFIDGKYITKFELYKQVADVFKRVSNELDIPIVWGGDWKTLKDGPHIELLRKRYP